MNLEKLKPRNWFKHEDGAGAAGRTVPVTRARHSPAKDSLTRLHDEMERWFDQLSSSFGLPRPT